MRMKMERKLNVRFVFTFTHRLMLMPATQLAVDHRITEIVEKLKEMYPIGNCESHPKDHCYSTPDGKNHWLPDWLKLMTWASLIVGPHHLLLYHVLTIPSTENFPGLLQMPTNPLLCI